VAYALILWQAPKELPPDVLNISIDGETVRFWDRPRGECARTKNVVDEVLRGLNRDDQIKVKCIRTELIPKQ
jgi:hypothetical protein